MTRVLCIVFLVATGSALAAERSYFSFAEAFSRGVGQKTEVSYRVYTAPMLNDIAATGMRVEYLDVSPHEIQLRVGDTYSLGELSLTAFGPEGNVQERAPLTLDFEGPADMLDVRDFMTYGTGIRAVRPGRATIWITSLMPSSGGEYIKESIVLVISE